MAAERSSSHPACPDLSLTKSCVLPNQADELNFLFRTTAISKDGRLAGV